MPVKTSVNVLVTPAAPKLIFTVLDSPDKVKQVGCSVLRHVYISKVQACHTFPNQPSFSELGQITLHKHGNKLTPWGSEGLLHRTQSKTKERVADNNTTKQQQKPGFPTPFSCPFNSLSPSLFIIQTMAVNSPKISTHKLIQNFSFFLHFDELISPLPTENH